MSLTFKKFLLSVIGVTVIICGIIAADSAQAKGRTSMYVIQKYAGYTYSYNDDGLVGKETYDDGYDSDLNEYYRYHYDKKNNIKEVRYYRDYAVKGPWSTRKITYKNGRIVKIVSDGGNTHNMCTIKCTYYKNGKLKKSVFKPVMGEKTYTVYKYNKKKRLTSVRYNGEKALKISYDKKGNIKKIGKSKIKNVYKKGRLIRVKYKESWGENVSYKVKYKKIKVNKKMRGKIKKQQKMIVNRVLLNLRFELYSQIW